MEMPLITLMPLLELEILPLLLLLKLESLSLPSLLSLQMGDSLDLLPWLHLLTVRLLLWRDLSQALKMLILLDLAILLINLRSRPLPRTLLRLAQTLLHRRPHLLSLV